MFLLVGCASTTISLQEVREFADASAKLGGYGELSNRFRGTYAREQPYLSPAADLLARETDVKRRAVYDDFVSVQKTVVLYMQTLSLLAGDARYDLSAQIDELGNGLKANADSGLEQRHVAAYTGLTRLLTRVIASGYQGRSVETMVRDGDADLQTLIDGMFDIEIPFSKKAQDRMLVTLAKVHYMSKSSEYRLLDRRYDLAQQGLVKVSHGHKKLRENLANLTGLEIRSALAKFASDLRMIHNAMNDKPI